MFIYYKKSTSEWEVLFNCYQNKTVKLLAKNHPSHAHPGAPGKDEGSIPYRCSYRKHSLILPYFLKSKIVVYYKINVLSKNYMKYVPFSLLVYGNSSTGSRSNESTFLVLHRHL